MEWVRPAAPHHVVKSHIVLEGNTVSKFTRRDAASNPTAPAAESTDEKKEYIEDAPIVVEFFNEADEPMEVRLQPSKTVARADVQFFLFFDTDFDAPKF